MKSRSSLFVGLTIVFMSTATGMTACGSAEFDPEESGDESGGGSGRKHTPWGDTDSDDASTSKSNPKSNSKDAGIPTQAEFCSTGELELPGSTARRPSCAGDLPGKFFRFAVCSCTDIALSGSVRTSSMNSLSGRVSDQGASIAANHFISFTGSGRVGGSAYAWGKSPTVSSVTYTGNMTVDHDLWSGGNVGVGSYGPPSVVAGNAYVRGQILPAGSLAVKGKTSDPGPFPEPCDCSTKLDVPGIVAPYKTQNDNDSIGLKKDALKYGGNLTLPCGRYYLTSIEGAATLNVQGTVALFIEKDVNVQGSLKIHLTKGAVIDIFVAGTFGLTGSAEFGSLDAPGGVRVYVGKDFGLTGSATIGGNIYAPKSPIAMTTQLRMRGSLFADNMAFTGGLDITYDQAVLEGGRECSKPGTECKTCGDCSGGAPACINGTCGACETNADCCAPQVCSNGSCIPDIR